MLEFVYRVDAEDKITFVDANWTPFAIENGLSRLTSAEVSNRLLWDFLSDITTRHLYRVFMHRVRGTGSEISFPFRCDAPDRRRFMKMTMRPLPESGLEFCSQILREELRPKVNLLDPNFPRRKDFVQMCSWCKKIKAPDWVEVEEGVARLDLFDAPQVPWVSHSICPDCAQALEKELM